MDQQGWISTDDVNLAACFLAFGASVRRQDPVWRGREFSLDELTSAGRERREPIATDIVIYYIDKLDIGAAQAITAAFRSTDASERFRDYVDGLGLDDNAKRELLALLEYLDRDESQGGHRPDAAKWIKITKGQQWIVMGQNASPETRRRFLQMLTER
jgi:hypothetical protein